MLNFLQKKKLNSAATITDCATECFVTVLPSAAKATRSPNNISAIEQSRDPTTWSLKCVLVER